MKVLVIAPHPDDEALGCGGTIALHRKRGDDVSLCIVTKAYTPDWPDRYLKNKISEIKRSNKMLEINKTFFLDFPTIKLDTFPQRDLNKKISTIIDEVKPEIVYIPHRGDLNKDHRLVFESSLVALRPVHHTSKRILCYEVLSETEWGSQPDSFQPNVYVNISDTISQKISACCAYKSEIKQHPHPRSPEGIDTLAKKRGSEVNLAYAESFMLIREVL